MNLKPDEKDFIVAAMEVVRVDMCHHYEWTGHTVCKKGHHASLRCHSPRKDCKDYIQGYHWPGGKK